MRKLIAIIQLTMDGVMQAPGGPEEDASGHFPHGGWAMPFGDESVAKALNDTMAAPFDLLLARRTYDIWAGFWPKNTDNPIGAALDKATKHVITHRAAGLDWKTSKQVEGEMVEGVKRLKASDGPELHLWGSHMALQTLIGAGIIDEYRLWIAPVVLGQGKRLFEAGVPSGAFTLVETSRSPSGVLFNTYRPAGPVPKA